MPCTSAHAVHMFMRACVYLRLSFDGKQFCDRCLGSSGCVCQYCLNLAHVNHLLATEKLIVDDAGAHVPSRDLHHGPDAEAWEECSSHLGLLASGTDQEWQRWTQR